MNQSSSSIAGRRYLAALVLLALLIGSSGAAAGLDQAGQAAFVRAVNLNGPALQIDGRVWEAENTAGNFTAEGKRFSDDSVLLRPPTDADRTAMIRSSVWGGNVRLSFSGLTPGPYQIILYVWEDNQTEQFDLLVNDRVVEAGFYSGSRGMWKRMGPWSAEADDGNLTVSAKGPGYGAANLSGIEIWAGTGAVPGPQKPDFNTSPTQDQLAFFENRIRPVLIEHCYECHSADADKIKGGLVVDSRAGIHTGGDTGPAIMPGVPESSMLIQALKHVTEDLAMPPDYKLPSHVITDFEEWIRQGAPDPRDNNTLAAIRAREDINWVEARKWWAFTPLESPSIPKVNQNDWPLNDIDHFILKRLENVGLAPSPDAEKRAWIRRATYDLTGLPPTPDEVQDFMADESPESRLSVVNRLLESPRYGERWGRHWLDVVRYADTAGDNSDYPVPQIHMYRDWVIDAFNRDMPYDEFIRHQLAGDLIPAASKEEKLQQIVATGYLANSRRFGSRVDDYPWHLTIEDTIDNLGRSFLGLTLSCARCHDHKFDPVTQKDYYGLYGIFHSTRYPWPGIELDKKQRDFVPLVPADEIESARQIIANQNSDINRLTKEISNLKKELKNTSGKEKDSLDQKLRKTEADLEDLKNTPLPFKMAYAVSEGLRIEDVPVHLKGDPARPGDIVRRSFLTVLGGSELPRQAGSSGRQYLADWIISKQTPLTARVMVNRIWQNHFGSGLVPTPNDFGKKGMPPTHPELLDYLAIQFRGNGWSIKDLHRQIMTSRTYAQSATRNAKALSADPSNELISGFPRRRLDAESIRDTMLFWSGHLKFGPAPEHPFPPSHDWNYTQHKPFKDVYPSDYRSVYLMTQRIQRHPFLAIFDGADPSTSTPTRTTSTTPLQALWLINDEFVHNQALAVANRILKKSQSSEDKAFGIRLIHEWLFARSPTPDEIHLGTDFLTSAGDRIRNDSSEDQNLELKTWASYIRVLFRLNEFVYID